MCKRQKGMNMKACNEFGINPMKMWFEHKTIMKVDHRIKLLELCFYQGNFFMMELFCYEFFYVWTSTYYFFPCCGLHSFKVLHNKWCLPRLLCEMKWLNILMDQKKSIIFLNFFPFVLARKNSLFVLIIWLILCITSLLYSISHMILTYLYLYKHVINDMGIDLSKEKEKPIHIKPTYFSKKLNKIKEKIKSFESEIILNFDIMHKDVYLQMIFF